MLYPPHKAEKREGLSLAAVAQVAVFDVQEYQTAVALWDASDPAGTATVEYKLSNAGPAEAQSYSPAELADLSGATLDKIDVTGGALLVLDVTVLDAGESAALGLILMRDSQSGKPQTQLVARHGFNFTTSGEQVVLDVQGYSRAFVHWVPDSTPITAEPVYKIAQADTDDSVQIGTATEDGDAIDELDIRGGDLLIIDNTVTQPGDVKASIYVLLVKGEATLALPLGGSSGDELVSDGNGGARWESRSGTAWPTLNLYDGRRFERTDLGFAGTYNTTAGTWLGDEFAEPRGWSSSSAVAGTKVFNLINTQGNNAGMHQPRKLWLIRWTFKINSSSVTCSGDIQWRNGSTIERAETVAAVTEASGEPFVEITGGTSNKPLNIRFNLTSGTLNRPWVHSWYREDIGGL